MNINIGKAIVSKMVDDASQPDRPLINLIMSIMREADCHPSDDVCRNTVVDAINTGIRCMLQAIDDDLEGYAEECEIKKLNTLDLQKSRENVRKVREEYE